MQTNVKCGCQRDQIGLFVRFDNKFLAEVAEIEIWRLFGR